MVGGRASGLGAFRTQCRNSPRSRPEAWHGSDKAWVDTTHDHLGAQDGECDGNYVYATGLWYDASISTTITVTVWDTNGCSAGWGHGDGIDFYQYRVCEQNVGCSAWRST